MPVASKWVMNGFTEKEQKKICENDYETYSPLINKLTIISVGSKEV